MLISNVLSRESESNDIGLRTQRALKRGITKRANARILCFAKVNATAQTAVTEPHSASNHQEIAVIGISIRGPAPEPLRFIALRFPERVMQRGT